LDFIPINHYYLYIVDPVIMSLKSSTSYAQEDLDLINSEILNLEHSASPLLSEARTPKSDSYGDTCNSRPTSSIDSLNLHDSSDMMDSDSKMAISKEETTKIMKDRSVVNADKSYSNKSDKVHLKADTVAMQLGIVEPTVIKTGTKDLIKNESKLSDEKEFDKSEELKPKVLGRGGLKFFTGAKLEAKDFNEKWQVSLNIILVKICKKNMKNCALVKELRVFTTKQEQKNVNYRLPEIIIMTNSIRIDSYL